MQRASVATRRMSETAVYDVLRPIVRVLKASGIEERTIQSAVRKAYGSKTAGPVRGIWLDHSKFVSLADAVTVWARDPEFIDEAGAPMKLTLGPGRHSLSALLKRAHVTLRPEHALRDLEALGSVKVCEGGRQVRLVSHVLLTVSGKRFLAAPMINEIRRFAETVEHNLCESPGPMEGRMHRWAQCDTLDSRQFTEVQRFVRLSGQSFLDAVDEKLSSCIAKRHEKRRVLYGVGIYVFVDRAKKRFRLRTTETEVRASRRRTATFPVTAMPSDR